MDGSGRLLVLGLLSIIGGAHWSDGAALNPFPLGTIGCLVSDVCDTGEICTNDLLFGSCQSKFSRILNGENKFELDTNQIEALEKAIRALIKSGFTWKDAYTQCALQNTLVQFQYGRRFDRYLCEDALGVASPGWSDDVKDEIADILLELLNSGTSQYEDGELSDPIRPQETGLDILNSNKRDEIVKVHKYFDKSKGLLKRDPFFVDTGSTYNMLYPTERLKPGDLYYKQSPFQDQDDGYDMMGPTDDRETFVEQEEGAAGEEPGLDPMNLNQLQQDEILGRYLKDLAYTDRTGGMGGLESFMGSDEPAVDMEKGGPDDLESVMERLVLTKEDQAVLAGLAKGTLYSEDLEPAQLARLKLFFQTLIQLLQTEATAEGLDPQLLEDSDEAEPDFSETLSPAEDPAEDMYALPGSVEEGVPEEELFNEEYSPSPEMTSDDAVADDQVDPELLQEVLQTGELPVDKKMSEEGEDAEEVMEDPLEPFDRNTMFLELSRAVTEEEAKLFVDNITALLDLPKGMIEFRLRLPGHNIELKVEDDPSGEWDNLKIREAAKAKNTDLQNATGITIVKAGEGEPAYMRLQARPPVVEAKQNNRYVVLTFILVGTIAGVVLAVVTIYLIKRHHRSRQKLANLASNSDGNEASKDYQDLCRQRMQGKSNEKPEPLHAASRIGSVSESQARSPSSRSSTSSWSEEPAATNMDISTGHIVLSYMEDHLRNQDRLDKEWDAVSGYVADPASTRVASDPCNTRKNRFADILPYDHSRVILSSGANVANSDFINASFITDHDPRNPAYITTQGPLPHTVADFWQMIWEQGSVVIVMLTKLTENGTSLCHRYWPEEGSDLYHIYEVHLVSEHIWCDDYLVRSFYLKNLQTNETRTVTQFHFLTWPQLSVPASIKALLDFRRKVNKSFRGRSCPIVVHCSDGCGRSGTYCLIDMVLNKMAKGAKEIDMAATLEHIRDQRMSMVTTKEQFQFSLAAVAEEVHAILKALPQ